MPDFTLVENTYSTYDVPLKYSGELIYIPLFKVRSLYIILSIVSLGNVTFTTSPLVEYDAAYETSSVINRGPSEFSDPVIPLYRVQFPPSGLGAKSYSRPDISLGLGNSPDSILGPSSFRGSLIASDGVGTFGEPVQKVCLFFNNLFEM